MAKNADIAIECEKIIRDVRSGVFSPVYLLMGEEPYYVEKVCAAIMDNALEEDQRDFNQMVFYGLQSKVEDIIASAKRYPVFCDRQLVVVKEAQNLDRLDDLGEYVANPLDSTVLVICVMGKSADKRRALYKNAVKCGAVVLESPLLKDYQLPQWIMEHFSGLGLKITPDAAQLFAYSTGADLRKIASHAEKIAKGLPEGRKVVETSDVEANVGVSREFSVFELNSALSYRDRAKALDIAAHLGGAAKFALPAVTSMLFMHFNRILKLSALMKARPSASASEKASVAGVPPFALREYDAAAGNYSFDSLKRIISVLVEYDYKSKGGDVSSDLEDSELLKELVVKILSV
ncbi:MAG: DNA polymerase III subunit delta [Bacteroidales bacterium]|nr:DNA polymerase III subunit delta [Bacteroidales bacterium]